MPIRDVLLALLVVAIWGFNFVVIKDVIDRVDPMLYVMLRYLVATAIFAGKRLLFAAVEKIRDMRIFLSLGDPQLRQSVAADHFA